MPPGPKTPQYLNLGPKVNFLLWNLEFCQRSISSKSSLGTHPQNEFRFRGKGNFLRAHPGFGELKCDNIVDKEHGEEDQHKDDDDDDYHKEDCDNK